MIEIVISVGMAVSCLMLAGIAFLLSRIAREMHDAVDAVYECHAALEEIVGDIQTRNEEAGR